MAIAIGGKFPENNCPRINFQTDKIFLINRHQYFMAIMIIIKILVPKS